MASLEDRQKFLHYFGCKDEDIDDFANSFEKCKKYADEHFKLLPEEELISLWLNLYSSPSFSKKEMVIGLLLGELTYYYSQSGKNLLLSAIVLLQEGQYQKAADIVLELSPSDPQALQLLHIIERFLTPKQRTALLLKIFKISDPLIHSSDDLKIFETIDLTKKQHQSLIEYCAKRHLQISSSLSHKLMELCIKKGWFSDALLMFIPYQSLDNLQCTKLICKWLKQQPQNSDAIIALLPPALEIPKECYARVEKRLFVLLNTNPSEGVWLKALEYAEMYFTGEDFSRAEKLCEALLKLQPSQDNLKRFEYLQIQSQKFTRIQELKSLWEECTNALTINKIQAIKFLVICKKILKDDPNHRLANEVLSVALIALNKDELADLYICKLDPETIHPLSLKYLAMYLQKSKDSKDIELSLRHLKRADHLSRRKIATWQQYTNAFFLLKDDKQLTHYSKKWAEKEPLHAEPRRLLALKAHESHHLKESLTYYREAIQCDVSIAWSEDFYALMQDFPKCAKETIPFLISRFKKSPYAQLFVAIIDFINHSSHLDIKQKEAWHQNLAKACEPNKSQFLMPFYPEEMIEETVLRRFSQQKISQNYDVCWRFHFPLLTNLFKNIPIDKTGLQMICLIIFVHWCIVFFKHKNLQPVVIKTLREVLEYSSQMQLADLSSAPAEIVEQTKEDILKLLEYLVYIYIWTLEILDELCAQERVPLKESNDLARLIFDAQRTHSAWLEQLCNIDLVRNIPLTFLNLPNIFLELAVITHPKSWHRSRKVCEQTELLKHKEKLAYILQRALLPETDRPTAAEITRFEHIILYYKTTYLYKEPQITLTESFFHPLLGLLYYWKEQYSTEKINKIWNALENVIHLKNPAYLSNFVHVLASSGINVAPNSQSMLLFHFIYQFLSQLKSNPKFKSKFKSRIQLPPKALKFLQSFARETKKQTLSLADYKKMSNKNLHFKLLSATK